MDRRNIYWNKLLKVYAKIQIYIVLLLLAVPIIMYIISPSDYRYEVDELGCKDQQFCMQDSNYTLISQEEARALRHTINRTGIIGTICLIGMMISNPDSRKNLLKIWKSLTKGKMEYEDYK